MADTYKTLAELVTLNDQNAVDLGANDILDDAPLVAALSVTEASNGTLHKYVKSTANPTVGFRAANAGREHDKVDDSLITATLQILDASFAVEHIDLRDRHAGGDGHFLDHVVEFAFIGIGRVGMDEPSAEGSRHGTAAAGQFRGLVKAADDDDAQRAERDAQEKRRMP